MRYKADIVVKLKNGVRDPQGSSVETILKRTNMAQEPNVEVGKFFTLEIEELTESSARAKLKLIAQEILSNPVLERYEIIRFEAL